MSADAASLVQTRAAARGAGRMRQWIRWWLAELWAALPERARVQFAVAGSGLAVRLGKDECSVLVAQAGERRSVGSVPLSEGDAESRKARLRALIEAHGGRADSVMLILSGEDFVRRVVSLPSAAEEALGQVVGFELDRITPFNATQANYAARILGRHDNGANIRVEVVAAPRVAIAKLLQRAGELGLVPWAVIPDEPGSATPGSELNLLPNDSQAAAGLSNPEKINIALGVVFIALVAVALVLPIWQKREMVIAILPRLHSASVESEKVVRTRDELEMLVKDANFILAKKHAQVPVSQVMEDLAANFSDNTWISSFEYKSGKQRELVITGETATATKVVEVLEGVKYLKNPAFRSPITRVPGQVAEKFVLAAEIHPRPLPAGIDDLLSPPQPSGAAPASVNAPQAGTQSSGMSGSAPASPAFTPKAAPVPAPPVTPAKPSAAAPATGQGDKAK